MESVSSKPAVKKTEMKGKQYQMEAWKYRKQ